MRKVSQSARHGLPGRRVIVVRMCSESPVRRLVLGCLVWALLPVTLCGASSGYYRTLSPPLPPTPAGAGNRPGLCDRLSGLQAGRVGRVRKMVVLADQPRQAAMMALRNPCQGVLLASYALAAGVEAEQEESVRCVDLYFEGVAFSWNFLQSPHAAARPEYSAAWQVYHESLARLMRSAQRFGRLDPSRGLRVVTPMGPQSIRTRYQGFVWKPADFSRVAIIPSTARKKLNKHFACPGLGVPLVVVRENRPATRFLEDQVPFNATVILRPSLAALAGQAPPTGAASSHGQLEFYDPLRIESVTFNQQWIAMATNTSAALEYSVRNDQYSPWQGPSEPRSAEAGQEKLLMLEPYQAGKYPVVFVHGFFSSPRIWANLANEILARHELRDRVQLIAYRYPTGRPFLESAAGLRRELLAMKATFDPRGEDPGIANTAVVGHSMGGLVAKLQATYSDDRIWYSAAHRPLSEINASDETRQYLRRLFYFEPLPFVRRVVFMGAPHDGTQLASRALGRVTACHIPLPASERMAHELLVRQNPGAFKPAFQRRISTSVDLMNPQSCLLRTIKVLCAGPNAQLHNIIGVGCLAPLAGSGDGVVSRRSAQHHSVSTEKQIRTTHGGLHEKDEAVQELQCILRRHILEANDVPSVDGYEIAEPPCEPPVFVVPDCQTIRSDASCLEKLLPNIFSPQLTGPELICPELICPELICPDASCPEPMCPGGPSADTSEMLPARETTTSTSSTDSSRQTEPSNARQPTKLPRSVLIPPGAITGEEPVGQDARATDSGTSSSPRADRWQAEDELRGKPVLRPSNVSGPELFGPDLKEAAGTP